MDFNHYTHVRKWTLTIRLYAIQEMDINHYTQVKEMDINHYAQ